MKIAIEIPRLEELIAEADKRGFIVEFLEPEVVEYHVVVKDKNGARASVGWVKNRPGKGLSLEAGGWRSEKGRLRIWIGKKIKVIGSALSWLATDSEERDDHYQERYISGKEKYRGVL